jgi:hypothetical protein
LAKRLAKQQLQAVGFLPREALEESALPQVSQHGLAIALKYGTVIHPRVLEREAAGRLRVSLRYSGPGSLDLGVELSGKEQCE